MARVSSLAFDDEAMSCFEWPGAKEGGKSRDASRVFFFSSRAIVLPMVFDSDFKDFAVAVTAREAGLFFLWHLFLLALEQSSDVEVICSAEYQEGLRSEDEGHGRLHSR